MIHAIFYAGLVFYGLVGAFIGTEAYEAGFTWVGATILGGTIFLALGHMWEKTTGVHDDD